MEKITICATKTSTEDVSAFGQEEVTPHGLSVKISTSGSSEKSIDGLTADDQLRTKSAHGFTCVLMGVPVWYGPESHKFSIEVFLGQYRSDKLKALKALDGMFGMIIVDSLSGSVDLIVDHIGSYKFFWVVTQTGFFASTLLSSLVKRIRVDGVEVNTSHCMRFLLTGISYGGESYIRSVNQTSNSELVTWNVRSKVVKTAQWWDLSFEEADKGTHK